MSTLSYNNWLFNLHIKVNGSIYAQSLSNSKKIKNAPRIFDEDKHFYFKENKQKYPNELCRLPILAIRTFIVWIIFERNVHESYIWERSRSKCENCKFTIRKVMFKK